MSQTVIDVLVVVAAAVLMTGYALVDEWRRSR